MELMVSVNVKFTLMILSGEQLCFWKGTVFVSNVAKRHDDVTASGSER